MNLVAAYNCHGDEKLFLKVLCSIVGEPIAEKSIIDLCCAYGGLVKQVPFKHKTYVDVLSWDAKYDGDFVQADVLGDHEIFTRKYDIVTVLDGIEHMHKPQGERLLKRTEEMALQKNVLFTPLDPWCLEPDSEDPKAHKCVWGPQDVPGYASIAFPRWHKALGELGAFFFWKTAGHPIVDDFERVRDELDLIPGISPIDWTPRSN